MRCKWYINSIAIRKLQLLIIKAFCTDFNLIMQRHRWDIFTCTSIQVSSSSRNTWADIRGVCGTTWWSWGYTKYTNNINYIFSTVSVVCSSHILYITSFLEDYFCNFSTASISAEVPFVKDTVSSRKKST